MLTRLPIISSKSNMRSYQHLLMHSLFASVVLKLETL
jgi:hypothetical protein